MEIGDGWADVGHLVFNQNVNIDRAESRGVELAAAWDISEAWSVRGNYTFTRSENKSGDAAGQTISGLVTSSTSAPAKRMANVMLAWAVAERLNLSLLAEGRYDRYRGVSAATGQHLYYNDHTLLHLGSNWRINDHLTFNARINNLLDKDCLARTCELLPAQDAYSCFDNYLVKDHRRNLWVSRGYRF